MTPEQSKLIALLDKSVQITINGVTRAAYTVRSGPFKGRTYLVNGDGSLGQRVTQHKPEAVHAE